MEAVEVVGLALVVVCSVLILLVVRRRLLDRDGGTIDVSLRRRRDGHKVAGTFGWSFGVARYDGDRLLWFKTFSLSPRPKHVFFRSALVMGARRRPHGAESVAVIADATIVDCGHDDEVFELAVPSIALPGLLAWVEAAPRISRRRSMTRASS
ncbi:MAG TPA: DUF2550 domain-containing protein [Mycobacteriales bacterium]|nr:DUF2550 domain-containing protein [Mycobacteriales bacterium]